MKQSKTYVLNAEIDAREVGEGVFRKIMGFDERVMLVQVSMKEGALAPVHSHPHSQTSYVVSGRFEVTVGEEKMSLAAGDGFYAAPELPHGVLCLEEGVVLDVFSPCREDFLDAASL